MRRRVPRRCAAAGWWVVRLLVISPLCFLSSLILVSSTEAGGGTGTAWNPEGRAAGLEIDTRGISLLHKDRKRTPRGFLYPYPYAPRPYREVRKGVLLRGSIELAGLTFEGDDDEARFDNYRDWSGNFLLPGLSLELRVPKRAIWVDAQFNSVASDDALYRASAGVRGQLAVSFFRDAVPRVYSNNAIHPLDGAGTSQLSMPAGLDVSQAIAATSPQRLRVERTRTGVQLTVVTPWRGIKAFSSYRNDERRGERPFGGSIGVSSIIEAARPVKDQTHEFSAGVELVRKLGVLRLSYDYSRYETDDSSLVWDNPFASSLDKGRIALEPDNYLHGIQAQAVVKLPWRGRLSSHISWRSARQNERLLPPTISATPPDWNTVTALSRERADARVNTLLLQSALHLQPLRDLTLRVRARYFDRDNRTRYRSYNPALGQYGYVGLDGGQGPVPMLRTGSIPYAYNRWGVEAGGTWVVMRRVSLGLEWEREQIGREHREQSRTWENQFRASVTSRRLSWTTLRFGYEFRDRRGSGHDRDPNSAVYEDVGGTSYSSSLAQRRYDLANRRRHLVSLRAHFPISDFADLSLTGGFRGDYFDTGYGLESEEGGDLNLEINIQPSPRVSFYAYMSYEGAVRKMAGVKGDGTTFPLDNRWWVESDTSAIGAGMGGRWKPIDRLTLEASYDYQGSREEIDYRYASLGATAGGLTDAEAGDGFPVLRNGDHNISISSKFRIFDELALRLFYRLAHGVIDDFHRDGLTPLFGSSNLNLAHIDRNYTVHIIGGGVELRF